MNRLLMPMVNEAFFALMEGVAVAEDIDLGMKLGTNHPMGPLTLADFIGAALHPQLAWFVEEPPLRCIKLGT